MVDLWPEFGAHGKESATLRHVLTHSVGLPAVPAETTVEDLTTWDKMTSVIAAAEPWWEPGTKMTYHAHTFGFIVGELVRRAAGRPISQVLRDDVAGPLGVADELFFGVPADALDRVARLDEPDGIQEMLAMMADMFAKVSPAAVMPTAASGGSPHRRSSQWTS
ncbi:MAG TPA: serine hydrolase domain-containing protein [Kribbella sp.]|nr:serine hydrolase domain-containing protein [Kribbella sp.]